MRIALVKPPSVHGGGHPSCVTLQLLTESKTDKLIIAERSMVADMGYFGIHER